MARTCDQEGNFFVRGCIFGCNVDVLVEICSDLTVFCIGPNFQWNHGIRKKLLKTVGFIQGIYDDGFLWQFQPGLLVSWSLVSLTWCSCFHLHAEQTQQVKNENAPSNKLQRRFFCTKDPSKTTFLENKKNLSKSPNIRKAIVSIRSDVNCNPGTRFPRTTFQGLSKSNSSTVTGLAPSTNTSHLRDKTKACGFGVKPPLSTNLTSKWNQRPWPKGSFLGQVWMKSLRISKYLKSPQALSQVSAFLAVSLQKMELMAGTGPFEDQFGT